MITAHDHPNTAFRGNKDYDSWVEVFHSRSSWRMSQISFKKDSESWVPFNRFKLIDASDVRPGFRVFRIRATRLEFKFANGKRTDIEDNSGKNYVIESPGRYVVVTGSGCRRVSDAQIADCLRPMRPHDKYVELLFEANPTWRNCFATFCMEGEHDLDWHKQPMELRSEPGVWFLRIEAKHGVKCAFTDGGSEWDSNSNLNYQIKLPGKYLIGKRHIVYLGVSDLDIHLDKSWNTDALKP